MRTPLEFLLAWWWAIAAVVAVALLALAAWSEARETRRRLEEQAEVARRIVRARERARADFERSQVWRRR